MMKLYYVPKTRASRARWMLEELEVSYQLVRLDPSAGDTRTEAHTARHPLQHVPVLETDDGPIFESAAIVLHLADRYPEKKLIPPVGTHHRGLAYQWLFFAMAEVEPKCAALAAFSRAKTLDSPQALEAKSTLTKTVRPLEARLSLQPFMLGESFTVVDLVLGAVVSWGNSLGGVIDLPHVATWLATVKSRPAYQRAIAD